MVLSDPVLCTPDSEDSRRLFFIQKQQLESFEDFLSEVQKNIVENTKAVKDFEKKAFYIFSKQDL